MACPHHRSCRWPSRASSFAAARRGGMRIDSSLFRPRIYRTDGVRGTSNWPCLSGFGGAGSMSRWLLLRSFDLASIVPSRRRVVPRGTSLFRSKSRSARGVPSTSMLQCSICCFEEGASCPARRSEHSTALKSWSRGTYVGSARACRPRVLRIALSVPCCM